MDSIIQGIAIYALPVIFAITLHEAAHGYVAKHYGDLTAYAQGRVTLNPLKHIDLMGTIIVPLAPDCVARRLHTPGMRAPRAWPDGRLDTQKVANVFLIGS